MVAFGRDVDLLYCGEKWRRRESSPLKVPLALRVRCPDLSSR
jgi:hypothetical protein